MVAVRFDGDGLPSASDIEPGYHEFLTTDERPGLQPTAAFPAPPRPAVVPTPAPRSGSPTGLTLVAIAVAMAVLAIALLLS